MHNMLNIVTKKHEWNIVGVLEDIMLTMQDTRNTAFSREWFKLTIDTDH